MKKIMTVDNEPDLVDLVKMILEGAGYEITVAYSGKECLEKLENETPDLILLDVMMPDLSGWDVFTRIRKKSKDQKVAFLSAIEVTPERKECLMQEGLSEYILKPFTADNLVATVRKIVGE